MIYVYFHYSSSLKRNGQPLNCHHVLLRTIIKYTKNCCKHLPQKNTCSYCNTKINSFSMHLVLLFEFVYKTDMCRLNWVKVKQYISTCIFQTLKYLLCILKCHHVMYGNSYTQREFETYTIQGHPRHLFLFYMSIGSYIELWRVDNISHIYQLHTLYVDICFHLK